MFPRSEWVWMPHPAHHICAQDCRFHLATYVGGYLVSTVGEYLPDEAVRNIIADCRGVTLKGRGDARRADFLDKIGWERLGVDRTYETMVFKAAQREDAVCCPWMIDLGESGALDSRGYNSPNDATRGHMELCEKWARAQEV